jgi:serine phosphatase RsbU (regulator of sigma subunit)
MSLKKDLKEKIILQQRDEIEKQRKELTESIKYASYIQNALLTSEATIKKVLPEHFIIFIPRDIVSGDFYWVSKKKSEIVIAVADCTGHGVPGAFMSILGITLLSEIVNRGNYTSAGSILNQLRESVMRALNQTGDVNEQKDGIDMALCIINLKTNQLEFSGAFNPVYIIKKNRLVELQGDKMPIGIAALEENSFTDHRLELEEGDSVYLFSDGFVDQFGGSEGKKFKYQPFRNLLLNINNLPVHKQKDQILSAFKRWKGNLTQLDDVLMFGFRYHVNN